jgi:hypothetical protein
MVIQKIQFPQIITNFSDHDDKIAHINRLKARVDELDTELKAQKQIEAINTYQGSEMDSLLGTYSSQQNEVG